MRKPRNLSPEERALWDKVASQAQRLHPERRAALSPAHPAKTVSKPAKQAPIPAFHIGTKTAASAPAPARRPTEIAMDHKAYRKMTRGKLRPEARIDLHGMTLAEAHPRLLRFIEVSHSRNLRLVLVITGKGRAGSQDGPIPSRPGVLRRQVPHWLHAHPSVLQVSPASAKHGGDGALYVYLRRRRG